LFQLDRYFPYLKQPSHLQNSCTLHKHEKESMLINSCMHREL
jgi:hypothetical protein